MNEPVSEDVQVLLVKAVDGELTADEARRLEEVLAAQPELRSELEMDMQIKSTTDALTARILEDARIEPPRPTSGSRTVLGTGFFLVFTGLAILFGFGLHALMTDPEVPTLVRAGIVLAGFGLTVLMGYALRMRLRAAGSDPYREVDR